jgi:hypothetical protein
MANYRLCVIDAGYVIDVYHKTTVLVGNGGRDPHRMDLAECRFGNGPEPSHQARIRKSRIV